MKKEILKIISVGLVGILVGSIGVVGANQAIQAIQNTQIKVSLNGQMQEFKDETTGEIQYPITYQDRTYLPLRNVANLSGLSVDYDANTNTAILSGGNTTNLNNTLSYNEMVEALKLALYSNLEKSSRGMHEGTEVDRFVFDIDNNGVPEIIYTGISILAQPEDTFQVFTMKDDKVVSTTHEKSLIYVPTNVYQTEDGVYVVELTGDGVETYRTLYKLELNGLELTKKAVLYSLEEYSVELDDSYGRLYEVNGQQVSHEEFLKKYEEIKKIKVLKSLVDDYPIDNIWKTK